MPLHGRNRLNMWGLRYKYNSGVETYRHARAPKIPIDWKIFYVRVKNMNFEIVLNIEIEKDASGHNKPIATDKSLKLLLTDVANMQYGLNFLKPEHVCVFRCNKEYGYTEITVDCEKIFEIRALDIESALQLTKHGLCAMKGQRCPAEYVKACIKNSKEPCMECVQKYYEQYAMHHYRSMWQKINCTGQVKEA